MLRSAALALTALLLLMSPVRASQDRFGQFQARFTEAQSLHRAVMAAQRAGRDGDRDDALRRLQSVWGELITGFRDDPPGPFARSRAFAAMLEGTASRLTRATRALADNQPEAATAELTPLRRDWIVLRREAGLYGLAECLDEASEALDAFQIFRRAPPDLGRAEARADIIAKAAAYRYALSRCDVFAVADGVVDADYRRLIEQAYAALDVVASVIRLREPGLLDRILIDLKAVDASLLQRFG